MATDNDNPTFVSADGVQYSFPNPKDRQEADERDTKADAAKAPNVGIKMMQARTQGTRGASQL